MLIRYRSTRGNIVGLAAPAYRACALSQAGCALRRPDTQQTRGHHTALLFHLSLH